MVIWDILVEWDISTSNSYHHLVASALNDHFLCSDQVNLSSNVDNWNSDIHLCDKSLYFLFENIIFTLLGRKWDWIQVEKIITFYIKFVFSHCVKINNTISEVLIVQMLLLPKL